MIPVMAEPPLCTLKELQDGTYDLADVADMVDNLLVKADNERLRAETRERARGRH